MQSSTPDASTTWLYLPITVRILNSISRNKLFGLSGIYLVALDRSLGSVTEFIISLGRLPAEIQSEALSLEIYFTASQLINNQSSGDSSIQWIQSKIVKWVECGVDQLHGFFDNGFKLLPEFNKGEGNENDSDNDHVNTTKTYILIAKPKYNFYNSLKLSGIRLKKISLIGTSICPQSCALHKKDLPIQVSLEVCPFGLSNVSIFSGYTTNGFVNYKTKDDTLFLSDIKYLDNMDGGIANIFINGYEDQDIVHSLGLVLGNLVKKNGSGELMAILSWKYILHQVDQIIASEIKHSQFLNDPAGLLLSSSKRQITSTKLNGNTIAPGKTTSSTPLKELQSCYCSALIESRISEAGLRAFKTFNKEPSSVDAFANSLFPLVDRTSIVAVTVHHKNGQNYWGSGVKISSNLIVTNRHVILDENGKSPNSIELWFGSDATHSENLQLLNPELDRELFIPFEGRIFDICYIKIKADQEAIDFNLYQNLTRFLDQYNNTNNITTLSKRLKPHTSALSVGYGLFFDSSFTTIKPLVSQGYISAKIDLEIFDLYKQKIPTMIIASCSCWAGSSGGGVFALDSLNKTETLIGIMVSNGKLSTGETLSKFNLLIPVEVLGFALCDLFVQKLPLAMGIDAQIESLWKLKEVYKDVFMESSRL